MGSSRLNYRTGVTRDVKRIVPLHPPLRNKKTGPLYPFLAGPPVIVITEPDGPADTPANVCHTARKALGRHLSRQHIGGSYRVALRGTTEDGRATYLGRPRES